MAIVLKGTYEVYDLYLNPVEPSKLQQAFQRIGRGFKWISCSNERTQVHDTLSGQPMKEINKAQEFGKDHEKVDIFKVEDESVSLHSLGSRQNADMGKTAPMGRCQSKVFGMIQSIYFDILIMIVILLSCISLVRYS